MYYVYVLESIKHDKRYIGCTGDIEKRLAQHNGKAVISTKRFSPWTVIYQEKYGIRGDAFKREKYLKSHAGREYLKKVIITTA